MIDIKNHFDSLLLPIRLVLLFLLLLLALVVFVILTLAIVKKGHGSQNTTIIMAEGR